MGLTDERFDRNERRISRIFLQVSDHFLIRRSYFLLRKSSYKKIMKFFYYPLYVVHDIWTILIVGRGEFGDIFQM